MFFPQSPAPVIIDPPVLSFPLRFFSHGNGLPNMLSLFPPGGCGYSPLDDTPYLPPGPHLFLLRVHRPLPPNPPKRRSSKDFSLSPPLALCLRVPCPDVLDPPPPAALTSPVPLCRHVCPFPRGIHLPVRYVPTFPQGTAEISSLSSPLSGFSRASSCFLFLF